MEPSFCVVLGNLELQGKAIALGCRAARLETLDCSPAVKSIDDFIFLLSIMTIFISDVRIQNLVHEARLV